jgi:hypothetical protein
MKKLFTIASLVIVTTACNTKNNNANKLNDSVSYAVYAGTPLDAIEDCEPVYIPLDMEGIHGAGDTIVTDSNGVLVEVLIRDAETRKAVMLPGFHKVRIDERLDYNKNFKR